MKNAPLLSIIIPYFNAHLYLTDLLDSIDLQTIRDFEIIIIDDKSEVHSVKKLKKIVSSNSHLNILLLSNPANLGAAATRNVGIERAKGKYVTFIDADDMLCGRFSLERRINQLEKDNSLSGIAGYTIKVNEKGKPLFVPDRTTEFFKMAVAHPENLRRIFCSNLLENSTVSASVLFFVAGSSMFRRADLAGFHFDPHYEKEEDTEWQLRFLEKKVMKLEMVPFHFRRIHQAQYHLMTPSKVTNSVKMLCKKILNP